MKTMFEREAAVEYMKLKKQWSMLIANHADLEFEEIEKAAPILTKQQVASLFCETIIIFFDSQEECYQCFESIEDEEQSKLYAAVMSPDGEWMTENT